MEKIMRAVLFVLIVVVLAVLIALWSGFLNIDQIRGAKAPAISATHNGVVAKGGQAPAFDVETGSVEIGTTNTTVKVPNLTVKRPQGGPAQNQPAQNQAAQNTANRM
jgi:hypothetical protein